MSRNTNTNTKITSNLTTIPLELRHAVYDVIANTEYDINHDPSVSRCNYDSITPLNVAQLSSAFRAEFLEHLCTTITFNVRLNFWPSPMPQPPFPYFYNYDPSNDNSEIIASRHWLEQLGSEAPLKKIRLILKNGIANNNTSHDWEAYVHVHIKADGISVTHGMYPFGFQGESGRIQKVADAVRTKLEGTKQESGERVGWDSVKELIAAINASQDDGKFVRWG